MFNWRGAGARPSRRGAYAPARMNCPRHRTLPLLALLTVGGGALTALFGALGGGCVFSSNESGEASIAKSTDGHFWHTVAKVTGVQGRSTDVLRFPAAQARYVRIRMTAGTTTIVVMKKKQKLTPMLQELDVRLSAGPAL